MGKILKELTGHSGSTIYLMESDDGHYIRKENNITRNVERLGDLYEKGYPVPQLLRIENNAIEMEYVHGLDMKNYLIHNNTHSLIQFIVDTCDCFGENHTLKDYSQVYSQKLDWLSDAHDLPFTKDELIDTLPKTLPCSTYHGDLTLENIIYTDPGFHMIDAVTIEYDSYIFDIAKMRQDLECKWFLRHTDVRLDTKLQSIQDALRDLYPQAFNDSLLILMLLRVYLHTKKGDKNYNFIMKEIHRLWK